MDLQSGNLPVNGASLYYEIRGTGRPLILTPGTPGTSAVYADLARHLSSHYRVITYDRRGYSRSHLTNGTTTIPCHAAIPLNADDLGKLIEHISPSEPVVLFATSSSGLIAVELVSARPDLVATAVLHEPMLLSLNPSFLRIMLEMARRFKTSGTREGTKEFLSLTSSPGEGKLLRSSSGYKHMIGSMDGNMTYFFENEVDAVPRYRIDPARVKQDLERGKFKLHIVLGGDTLSDLSYITHSLAGLLGLPVKTFPGGHLGYMTHPAQFAERLEEIVDSAAARL